MVVASILVARAILLEAGLSFLGLGDPNLISWGSLLSEAQERIGASVWLAFFPGAAISLLVLCVNLFGDGINDVLNPKLRKRTARHAMHEMSCLAAKLRGYRTIFRTSSRKPVTPVSFFWSPGPDSPGFPLRSMRE